MSPQDFEKCVAEGGRVRTKQLSDGRYIHLCWDKAGKSHAGEVREKAGAKLRKAIK